MLTAQQCADFDEQGYVVVDGVLSQDEVRLLTGALEELERRGPGEDETLKWSDGLITSFHTLPLQPKPLSEVFQYRPLLELAQQLIGPEVRVTGGLLLDKDPAHNWDIGWHQDNGIYVSAIPEGEPQDIRSGLPVLSTKGMEMARNVTCRIALDASSPESGGLFVLPGSHKTNLCPNNNVSDRLANEKGVGTTQAPGSVLCYCPLLLHRSEKSRFNTGRRRVLVLQYAPADLQLPGTTCYPFPQPVPLTPIETMVA